MCNRKPCKGSRSKAALPSASGCIPKTGLGGGPVRRHRGRDAAAQGLGKHAPTRWLSKHPSTHGTAWTWATHSPYHTCTWTLVEQAPKHGPLPLPSRNQLPPEGELLECGVLLHSLHLQSNTRSAAQWNGAQSEASA